MKQWAKMNVFLIALNTGHGLKRCGYIRVWINLQYRISTVLIRNVQHSICVDTLLVGDLLLTHNLIIIYYWLSNSLSFTTDFSVITDLWTLHQLLLITASELYVTYYSPLNSISLTTDPWTVHHLLLTSELLLTPELWVTYYLPLTSALLTTDPWVPHHLV